MNSKLLLLSMLVCLVAADVSELRRKPSSKTIQRKPFRSPVPLRKLQARNTDPAHVAELFGEELLAEDIDEPELTSFQLTADHQDFQAPYHYEKPTVENDYLPPVVVPKEQPADDYLPPFPAGDNVAKRHVKLRGRI
ncbi:hypothetical protein quinque_002930 [Culex quinquefasciatus]